MHTLPSRGVAVYTIGNRSCKVALGAKLLQMWPKEPTRALTSFPVMHRWNVTQWKLIWAIIAVIYTIKLDTHWWWLANVCQTKLECKFRKKRSSVGKLVGVGRKEEGSGGSCCGEGERYSSSSSSAVERETVPQRSKVFTGRFSIMIPLWRVHMLLHFS